MRIVAAAVLAMLVAWAPMASAQASKEQDLKAGGAKQLTTDEIRALHADHTVYHRNVVSGAAAGASDVPLTAAASVR